MYNGRVDLKLSKSGHRYKVSVDGSPYRPVKGVTTYLSVVSKDGLITWAAGLASNTFSDHIKALLAIGNGITTRAVDEICALAKKAHTEKRDKGADSGSLIHEWIADYLKGNDRPIPENTSVIRGIEAFFKWEKATNPLIEESERPLYSIEHDFAGKCDIIAIIKGKRYIIDLKSGEPKREFRNGKYTGRIMAYPEHFLQNGGYAVAYQEETANKVDGLMVVYISAKTGEYQQFETDEVIKYKLGFLYAKGLYEAINY